MRIVTWNCCRGKLENKLPLLDPFAYDIAVMQECAKSENIPGKQFWVGNNPRQGVAVVARGAYEIEPMEEHPEVLPYFVPLRVTGPRNFILFAVWAKANKQAPYVRTVVRAIRIYYDLIEREPSVIIGDLNTNAIWINARAKHENHSAMVALIKELKLDSCYHHHLNEEHGEETKPTFYLTWKEHKPYHLDFCIVPEKWLDQITELTVPPFDSPWNRSDHRPLFVEFSSKFETVSTD